MGVTCGYADSAHRRVGQLGWAVWDAPREVRHRCRSGASGDRLTNQPTNEWLVRALPQGGALFVLVWSRAHQAPPGGPATAAGDTSVEEAPPGAWYPRTPRGRDGSAGAGGNPAPVHVSHWEELGRQRRLLAQEVGPPAAVPGRPGAPRSPSIAASSSGAPIRRWTAAAAAKLSSAMAPVPAAPALAAASVRSVASSSQAGGGRRGDVGRSGRGRGRARTVAANVGREGLAEVGVQPVEVDHGTDVPAVSPRQFYRPPPPTG